MARFEIGPTAGLCVGAIVVSTLARFPAITSITILYRCVNVACRYEMGVIIQLIVNSRY